MAGLGEGAFGGIDEEHDAVDEFEGAFDFAAEVGVTGRIDDVDFVVVVTDAGGFGEDGDAAFAFEFVGVHDAVFDVLIGAEDAGLAEHGVNEGGFAMIDVRNDGDVAEVL